MGDKTERSTKTCRTCRRDRALAAFSRDRSRTDGLSYVCRECKGARARDRYQPKPRPVAGRRFVPARDGDYRQARRRVNHLVDIGSLPPANECPCTDCGHRWSSGERRHEYDHHLGYAAEHHEDVQVVCTSCHHARERRRGGMKVGA